MDQLKALIRSSQLLLGAGVLLFIFLFFDWQQVPLGSVGRSGWHGWGVAVGLFAIALLVWEAAHVLAVTVKLPVKPAMVSAGLAVALRDQSARSARRPVPLGRLTRPSFPRSRQGAACCR